MILTELFKDDPGLASIILSAILVGIWRAGVEIYKLRQRNPIPAYVTGAQLQRDSADDLAIVLARFDALQESIERLCGAGMYPRNNTTRLTPKERTNRNKRIRTYAGRGMKANEIARLVGCSPSTVRTVLKAGKVQ